MIAFNNVSNTRFMATNRISFTNNQNQVKTVPPPVDDDDCFVKTSDVKDLANSIEDLMISQDENTETLTKSIKELTNSIKTVANILTSRL